MSAVVPRPLCKSTLAPRFSSILTIPQVAVGCSERIDRPFLAQPLDHRLQLASLGRLVDLEGQRGGRAHRRLVRVRWGGRCGGGRRRCVLLGELRGGRVAQGGAVVVVEQRGVGLVRESAAADAEEENGNCGNHAEHHREHRPGLGERQRSAQGATAAENEVCVLPDKVCNNFEPPCFGIPQGGAAFVVEQLRVGVGVQQGLHACLLPFVSGMHQGGAAVAVLQVGVGRALQQEAQDGEVTAVRSFHEGGASEAAWQVDARAALQQHPHHLQLAVGCGGVQQAEG
eukprot:scaffold98312_cov69-Phaeocystis_antarctica.AAC.2